MFSGIKYLHECCSLVHRDIKPENILINEDKTRKSINVRIGDFGLAVFERKPPQPESSRIRRPDHTVRRRHPAGDVIEPEDNFYDVIQPGVYACDVTNLVNNVNDVINQETSADDVIDQGASAGNVIEQGIHASDVIDHGAYADDVINQGTNADDVIEPGAPVQFADEIVSQFLEYRTEEVVGTPCFTAPEIVSI